MCAILLSLVRYCWSYNTGKQNSETPSIVTLFVLARLLVLQWNMLKLTSAHFNFRLLYLLFLIMEHNFIHLYVQFSLTFSKFTKQFIVFIKYCGCIMLKKACL
jgi:hypothetical protein